MRTGVADCHCMLIIWLLSFIQLAHVIYQLVNAINRMHNTCSLHLQRSSFLAVNGIAIDLHRVLPWLLCSVPFLFWSFYLRRSTIVFRIQIIIIGFSWIYHRFLRKFNLFSLRGCSSITCRSSLLSDVCFVTVSMLFILCSSFRCLDSRGHFMDISFGLQRALFGNSILCIEFPIGVSEAHRIFDDPIEWPGPFRFI